MVLCFLAQMGTFAIGNGRGVLQNLPFIMTSPQSNLILTLTEHYLMHLVAVVGVELFAVLSDSPAGWRPALPLAFDGLGPSPLSCIPNTHLSL